MKAGDLRHRITIQIPRISVNDFGESIKTFVTWKTVWAAIEPDTGNTTYAAKQLNANADGKIRIRHVEGLLPTMRIYYSGRYFSILSFYQPQEVNDQIIILYKEALD